MEKEKTISEALNISDEWVVENESRIEDALLEMETVSDCMENLIMQIKTEEFGKGDYEISDYERKILFAGYLIGQLVVRQREAARMGSLIGHILQQSRRPRRSP